MSEAQSAPADTDTDTDQFEDLTEDAILDVLEEEIPNWTENEKSVLAILGLSPDPLTREELAKKADVGMTYIYKRDNLRDTGLIKTVSADDDSRRKLWTTTERGDKLVQRFKDKKKQKESESVDEYTDQVFNDSFDESDSINKKQSDPYVCNLCRSGFDSWDEVRDHILDSVGNHRGRSPQEPGIVSANPNLVEELPTRFKGSVKVKGDIGPETVRKGNVKTVGSFDATGGKPAGDGAKRLREPTTIQNRRVKSTQSESVEGTEDDEPFLLVELSQDEVFEVLGSTAPESVRRRLYDQIVGEAVR